MRRTPRRRTTVGQTGLVTRAAAISLLLAATVVGSGCTTDARDAPRAHVSQSSAPHPGSLLGGSDSLVVVGDGDDLRELPGVASFSVSNVDAGPILVSTSTRSRMRIACPGTATVRVNVGKGSAELTVRQQLTGEVLLQTAIRAGHSYVLARAFGALISRDQPVAVGPASFGCGRR
jgi:hypothetical protein